MFIESSLYVRFRLPLVTLLEALDWKQFQGHTISKWWSLDLK